MLKSFTIIPSIRSLRDFEYALNSNSKVMFLSEVHIGNLQLLSNRCHSKDKIVLVNTDLIGGLSTDQTGIKLLKNFFKVDGIISSNSMCVNISKSIGLYAIQRFFLIDSRGVESGLKALKNSRCDAIEVLPGPLATKFKEKISRVRDVPLLGGGFINNKGTVFDIYKAGFGGVTTSTKELWNDYSYLKQNRYQDGK